MTLARDGPAGKQEYLMKASMTKSSCINRSVVLMPNNDASVHQQGEPITW